MPICAIIFAHSVTSDQHLDETQTARTTTTNKQQDRTISQSWKENVIIVWIYEPFFFCIYLYNYIHFLNALHVWFQEYKTLHRARKDIFLLEQS